MTPIGGISNVSAAYSVQAQTNPAPAKVQPTQSGQDSVQLSKTAQAALSSGDADHDGDSR